MHKIHKTRTFDIKNILSLSKISTMKKLLLGFILLILTTHAWADGPFRAHRFDSFKALKIDTNNIVFVGNSITDMHDWAQAFGNPLILNRGVSGALSSEILENIDLIVTGHPQKLFLMIGTNDLGSGITPEQVADNIRQIVSNIRSGSPKTQIFLESILPSTVGSRTLENERNANEFIQQIAQDCDATYIDLWNPLFNICLNHENTLDGLHLKASGYKIWCDIIAPYVGSGCLYPTHTAETQKFSHLWGSHAMRASYFSVLPIRNTDILFFGDEMVKCGEWNELLHNPNIRNMGTGWGYDENYNSISIVDGIVEAAFANHVPQEGSPKAIILYTGTGNANSDSPLDSVSAQYHRLVQKLHDNAPSTKIYLLSLMPTSQKNGRITSFNEYLQDLDSKLDYVEYIDIFSALSKNGIANPAFFEGNYLYGKGYLEVAKILAKVL